MTIGVIALIVLNWTTDIFRTPREKIIEKEVIVVPPTKPSEFPDYGAYKSLPNKISLVKDNPGFVTKNYKKIGEVNKNYSLTGKFRRAYIFIDASVDDGRPLTAYDSIYVEINHKGGHLLRNKSLPILPSDTTKLLYDMREIPYIESIPYSENKQPLFIDWLTELSSKETMSFYSFLSSWRMGGLIKEISIAFECEENSECNIILK
ncbi:MAG: hypothetical protein AABX99_02350 [Nanoarchaeota archaeon]